MSDITITAITDIEPYSGPHAIPGIRFRPAREALGVTAWGMNVIELDPHCDGYPKHDHVADGQEEVYVVLSGSLTAHVGGDAHELRTGDAMRLAAAMVRKFTTGDDAATLLVVGNTPGKAYEPPSWG